MKKNIGTQDRLVRLVLALLLLTASWYAGSYLLHVAALFTFYEALAGWCIIYQILGKNSCPISREK